MTLNGVLPWNEALFVIFLLPDRVRPPAYLPETVRFQGNGGLGDLYLDLVMIGALYERGEHPGRLCFNPMLHSLLAHEHRVTRFTEPRPLTY